MLTRSYSDRSNGRNRDMISKRQRDYDGLKQQCDNAIHELMLLRRQHGETMERFIQTIRELEYYRGQNQVMINQLHQATQELSSLRVELAAEKRILNRSQQNIPEDDTTSCDSPNNHLMPYDSNIEGYETLRKRYKDLYIAHSAAVDKMNMMTDEINQLKKQCNDLFYERNIAVRQRDGFKDQCTAAISRWNSTLEDRNNLQEAIQKVQQQHEEAVNEMKAAVALSVKSSEKLKDLSKAHDAAIQEYNLIMSERDSVHYELEKLSEDLSQAYIKNKSLQNELKSCRDEKKTLQLHIESLKHDEIVLERERIRALCDSLRKQRIDDMSKLAQGDCDDIMKQKCETAEERNNFKEKLETQLEEEPRRLDSQSTGCYSQDSAIDTHLQDLDTEVLNIDLGDLRKNEDLGIDLLGGKDDPLYINDNAIYISSVNKNSVAARKLRVNDCILRVNSLDCSSVSKQLVLETMRSLSNASVVIRRRKSAFPSKSFFTTQFQVNEYDHGISLETGIYINKITPGSLAANNENLNVGDRVLSINNTALYNIKHLKEAMLLLHEPCDVLTITTMRSTYCVGSCGASRQNYKKYINNATQTVKYSGSRFQESYQKPQNVKSRKMMLDVPKQPFGNPTPVNNSNSEQDQEGAIAGLDSISDALIPYPRSGKYTNIATNSNAEDIKDSQPSTSHTGKSILNCSEPPNSNEMSQFHHNHSPSIYMHYNTQTTRSSQGIMTNTGLRGEDMTTECQKLEGTKTSTGSHSETSTLFNSPTYC